MIWGSVNSPSLVSSLKAYVVRFATNSACPRKVLSLNGAKYKSAIAHANATTTILTAEFVDNTRKIVVGIGVVIIAFEDGSVLDRRS